MRRVTEQLAILLHCARISRQPSCMGGTAGSSTFSTSICASPLPAESSVPAGAFKPHPDGAGCGLKCKTFDAKTVLGPAKMRFSVTRGGVRRQSARVREGRRPCGGGHSAAAGAGWLSPSTRLGAGENSRPQPVAGFLQPVGVQAHTAAQGQDARPDAARSRQRAPRRFGLLTRRTVIPALRTILAC